VKAFVYIIEMTFVPRDVDKVASPEDLGIDSGIPVAELEVYSCTMACEAG
jgi:hypothetical protein